jgi:hypothetical protein
MQKSQIVSQSFTPVNPSPKITIDVLCWDEHLDTAEHVKTLDISHWTADQMKHFWEFVHAN